jgi:hypothetical protein
MRDRRDRAAYCNRIRPFLDQVPRPIPRHRLSLEASARFEVAAVDAIVVGRIGSGDGHFSSPITWRDAENARASGADSRFR